jgi:hypothetical protein
MEDRTPAWDGQDYVDRDTGVVLPTWNQALDQLGADPDARPAHVMRFGSQVDLAGILPGTPDADRTVRYLTKYLTKAIAEPYAAGDPDPAYLAHVDRLEAELRWLPCSPGCANWLRYGIQPENPGPGLIPGRCTGRRTTGNTSDAAAAASSSPASGPARPWLSIGRTGPPSSVKPSCPPGSSPPRSNGWPARSRCPTGRPGSCGPTPDPTPPSTPGSSCTPSPNGNAGAPSTKRRKPPRSLWTTVRQPGRPESRSSPALDWTAAHISASPDVQPSTPVL